MAFKAEDFIYPESMEFWNNIVESSKKNLILENTIFILKIALEKLEQGEASFEDVKKDIESWISEFGYTDIELSNVIEGVLHLSKVGPEFVCWLLDCKPDKKQQKNIMDALKHNKDCEKAHPSDTQRSYEVLLHRKTIEGWQKTQDILYGDEI